MINMGDHVAVGLSGGKDSLLLLTLLKAYQKFSPEIFKLTAITIDLGFKDTNPKEVEALKEYCKNLGVEYIIEPSEIAEIIFTERKEKNPCSLCSKMRRGALNTSAIKIGANKLALGHHAEDLLETFLLSFIYEGRLSTFKPVSYMDRTDMTLIRPMIYISEDEVKCFAKKHALPVVFNPCPKNHVSQREYMKNLVNKLNEDIPIAKLRMLSALYHPERNSLLPEKGKSETRNDKRET